MEFQITLEQKYFAFAMEDRLSFDAWVNTKGATISMSCTGAEGEEFWLKNAIFPAVQNFLRHLEYKNMLPEKGETFGEILAPSGKRIPLALPD